MREASGYTPLSFANLEQYREKVLLTATLIAAIGTSATAQDIQPPILITPAPIHDDFVGTAGPANGLILLGGSALLTRIAVAAANSDDD